MLVTLNYIKAYLGKNWHHEWMSGLQDHYCPEEESKLVKSEVCQTLVVDSLHALILVRRRLKGTPWTPCLTMFVERRSASLGQSSCSAC